MREAGGSVPSPCQIDGHGSLKQKHESVAAARLPGPRLFSGIRVALSRGNASGPDTSEVSGIVATVLAAAGLFAGTNIDDLVVLAVLFSSGRATGALKPWQVWTGQATGFAILVGASVTIASALAVVPGMWIGLLGLIPLGMGALGLAKAMRAHRFGEKVPEAAATGLVSVSALTLVNGADNLTVYPPVFRTIGTSPALITIAVFAAGVVVWCMVGSWLGGHHKVVEIIRRWGHWIVPAVFVAIGVTILLGSGTLTKIL
jgi:cadmium resistance protein CadD (predicted permease)